MKNILSLRSRAVLRKCLGNSVILVFDYDGTLSPIAKRPSQARLSEGTAALLRKLVEIYPTALVTGRSRPDIIDKVARVSFLEVVGNHGAEWLPPIRTYRRESALVNGWEKDLQSRLGKIAGLQIESKKLSLSVHLRNVEDLGSHRGEIEKAVFGLSVCRVIAGKQVFNLIPKTLPNKGDAVVRLLKTHRARRALYVGDDRTDEDVFRRRDPRILGIHVGDPGKSSAEYRLPRQGQINTLLRQLIQISSSNLR